MTLTNDFGIKNKLEINRPLKLRGVLLQSKRDEMKREDRAALGGMRNPASSLARAPSSCVAGDMIRPILDEIIADHESL